MESALVLRKDVQHQRFRIATAILSLLSPHTMGNLTARRFIWLDGGGSASAQRPIDSP